VETETKVANWNGEQGVGWYVHSVNLAIADNLRKLIETRHLYQGVKIPANEISSETRTKVIAGYHSDFDARLGIVPTHIFLDVSELTKTVVPTSTRLSSFGLSLRM